MSSAAFLVSGASLLALCAAAYPGIALAGGALPSGGQFSAGAGSIASTAGGLNVTQSSSRGIINWQSFSIGQGQSVQIANGSGATLNRVTGGDLSTIAGSLTSTGSVYLVNPAGVIVMPTGQVVTTGSFVASTRDVSDTSFLAGGTLEFTGGSSGTVVNQGSIASSGGDVVLIGQSVSNSGQISAPNGTAALAAGDDVLLRQGGDQAVLINAGAGSVTNTGNIAAAQAQLAAADGNVYALATNNGGVIRATGTATKGGHVYLTSDDGDVTVGGTVSAANADGSGGTIVATGGSTAGSVTVSGTLNAKATGKRAKGGNITVTASSVTVAGTAVIAADGGGAGGTVLIGGDRHGGATPSQDFSSTPVADAQTTTVAAGAVISAAGGSAGGSGNGGNVVVWSNQSTSFAGAISANGGAAGGNGGFVEVSGAQVLSFTGTVDTSAPLGLTGTLLLDPEDVTIYSSTDNSVPALSGLPSGETQASGVFTPSAASSYILNTTIDAALASNNVTITTGALADGLSGTGNIHFGTNGGTNTGSNSAPIYWSTSNTLTLNAVGQIDMPGGTPSSSTGGYNTAAPSVLIDAIGGGAIVFNASGSSVPPSTTSSAAAIISIEADIQAHGGPITFNTMAADYEVEVGDGITVSNVSNANGAGTISITADYVRMGSLGSAFSGALDTTGNVYIQPFSAGAVTIGNNSATVANPGGSNYNSANNIALIDQKSISNITAANLVIGNAATTSMTLETPTNHEATINAANANNVELLTGTSGSVTQDAHTTISVDGGAGGLAVSTGGSISLPGANLIGSVALQAGGNIALSGQTTATSSGTLTIGTVNGISGITTTGAGATTTLINSGTVTQATGAGQAITTPNLVLEGGGAFTLDNLANTVSSIAGSVGSLSLTDDSALATASLSDDLASPTTFNGIGASGAVTIVGDGSVTIGSGAPIATTAGDVMIEDGSAAGGAVTAGSGFVNDDGASAFNVTGGGAWRVYSQDPRDNTLGGLNSANYSFVQYDAPNTYGAPGAATTFTNANAALNASASGNGFLYGVAPTITAAVTTTFTKQYDATTTLPGSGSIPVSYGAPVVTVGGSAVTNLGAGGTADTVTLNQAATLSLPASNFYPDKDVGTYTVGVPGVSLQSATDANGVTVYGYNVTPSAAGTATITPKPLSVIGLTATNKVYDGTTADTLGGAASLESAEAAGSGSGTDGAPYSGDSVTLSGTPVGTFSQKNVGNGISVAVSGLTLTNNANSDYTLSNLTGLMADITPAPVTVSGSRYYDGMTDAPGAILTVSGEIPGDPALTATGTGSVSSPNASATPQNLLTNSGAVTGLTLSGTGASNYSLVSGTLTINPEPLTITASNQSRSYGPTGGALVLGSGETTDYTTSGLVNSETIGSVTLTGTAAATSATTNAGTLSGAITPSAATGGAFNPSNYAISYVNGDVTITPALLTVTGSKDYDGTTGFATNQLTVSGGVNGQTVSLTAGTGTSSNPNAATYAGSTLTGLAASVTGGTGSDLASNYQLPATGTLTINPEPLTITASNQSRSYGPTGGALVLGSGETTDYTTSGLVNSETIGSVTLTGTAAATSATTNAGTLSGAITPSAATGGAFNPSNYAISYVNGDVTITPALLTVTGSKDYDGTTGFATNQLTVTGGVNGQTVSLTAGTGTSSSPNAATYAGSTLTGLAASVTGGTGSDLASNYQLPATGTLTINPEPLTISAVTQTKVYDGTTVSTNTPELTSGTLEGGDTLTNLTQAYNSKNVLGTNGSTLSVTNYTLSDPGNYTVTTLTAPGTITPEAVTVTAVPTSKTYDGTTSSPGTPAVTSGTIYSPDAGTFTQTYNTPNVGTGLTLTPTGSISDGNGGNNYTVTYAPVNTGAITAEALTISAVTQTKVYDGTTVSTNTPELTSGTLEGSDTLTNLTQAYSSKNVLGTNGSTLSVTNYTLSDPGNYTVTTLTAPGTITPEAVTVTAVPTSKTYDGTTSSPGTPAVTSGTIYSPDAGTFTQTYNTPNVGTGLTLTPTGSISDGNGGNNYTVTYAPVNTGAITAEALTISAVTQTKVYDGTTVSTNTPELTSGTLEGSDTLTNLTQAYSSKNVLGTNGSTLSVTNYTLSDPGNYTVTTLTAPGTITPEAVTVTAVPTSKTYDGTTSSPGTPAVTSGTIYSPDAGTFTQTYNTPNAGTGLTLTPTGSISDGNGGNNYTVTYVPVNTGAITAEPLTISAVTQTKVYDGTTVSTNTPELTSGTLEGGDTLTNLTQAYNSKNVLGTNGSTLSVTNYTLSDPGNYTVTTLTAPGTITPEAVTVTAVPTSKTYDGTTSSPGTPAVTSGTIYSPDAGTFTQTYNTPNVGTGLTLTPTGSISDGNGGNNYTVTYAPVNTGAITAEALTISAVTQTKVYDGTTVSTNTPELTSGTLEGSDTLTNLTQAYSSKNVLGTNGSTLSVTNYTLSDPGNYTVTTLTAPGTITPEAVTVTAVPTSKTYDGTTSSPGTPAVTSGTIYSPDGGTFTQTYNTPNAGTGLTLTPTGSISDGNGGNNYTVTYAPVDTGAITPRPIVVSGTRVYDAATDAASGILTITNVVPGDAVALGSGTGVIAAKNVGPEAVTGAGTLTLINNAAGDYTLAGLTGTVTVTPLPVTVTGTRVYDGATDASATILTIPGDLDGGGLTVSGSGTLVSKNVGPETIAALGSLTLGGAASGNYTLTGGTVTITPEPLVVTAVPSTKTYDGTTTSSGTPIITSGALQGADTGGFIQTYGGKNAGTGIVLTPSGAVSDGDGGKDYTITYVPISTGIINPRPVVLTGTRPFDGATDAPAPILTVANLVGGDSVSVGGGSGILVSPAVGNEKLAGFGTLTLLGASAGNYTFIGGGGTVRVTPGVAVAFPPLDETISGIGGTPFTDAVYDGGILGIFPRQNGVVTGLIATIDAQAVTPDTALACTMITYGTVCIQNGLAPQPVFGMTRTN